MAHTLQNKKSKQQLTRKGQTFRKGETQSHRPKLPENQETWQRGCRVEQLLLADATRQKQRGAEMKTLTHLLSWQSFLQFFSFFFLFFYCSTSQASEATFVWSPNTETNLAGYNIYYGTESGAYFNPIDVGNPEVVNDSVTTTLSALEEGVTYYFAATAYDTDGFESAYSQEVMWTAPVTNYPCDDADGDGICNAVDGSDTDGDGFTDAQEVVCESDPADPNSKCLNDGNDTDGDGFTDAQEVVCESDPADPNSKCLNVLSPKQIAYLLWIYNLLLIEDS